MSVTLPDVDLTSVAVGQSGVISLASLFGGGGIPATNSKRQLATARIHNESGAGLRISLPHSNQSFNLPAGGWVDTQPQPGESEIDWQVIYFAPGGIVNLLLTTFFYPGEPVPPMTLLGNSPIAGAVSTSSIQTLSNEGSAAGTKVIDIGDATLSDLVQFFSNYFVLKVDQAGVSHNVIQGQTSGNPVLIGQSGDTAEVAGTLLVDQNETVVGNESIDGTLTVTGASSLNSTLGVTGNETVGGTLGVTGVIDAKAGVISNGKYGTSTAGDIIDASGADTGFYLRGATNSHRFHSGGSGSSDIFDIDYQGHLTLTNNLIWQNGVGLGRTQLFTGSGSGTYTHNLGATPTWVAPIVSQAGSATQGYDAVGSTTVHVTLGAALAFTAFCLR